MSKTSKLYNQLKGHFDTFEAEHEKNMVGNKADASATGEVKLYKRALLDFLFAFCETGNRSSSCFFRGTAKPGRACGGAGTNRGTNRICRASAP